MECRRPLRGESSESTSVVRHDFKNTYNADEFDPKFALSAKCRRRNHCGYWKKHNPTSNRKHLTDENKKTMKRIVLESRHVSFRDVAEDLNTSRNLVYAILVHIFSLKDVLVQIDFTKLNSLKK